MDDLDFALEHMSHDHDVEEWILMRDVLRLSEEAVHSNTDMLPSQVFGRVSQVIVYFSLLVKNLIMSSY